MVASMKVYPKLFAYIEANNERLGADFKKGSVQAPVLESYETHPNSNCLYYIPTERIKDFILTPYAMPALKSMENARKH